MKKLCFDILDCVIPIMMIEVFVLANICIVLMVLQDLGVI